jgi:hypothetical protein
MRTALRILTIGALVGAAPPALAGEDVDLIAVHRIKNEAFRNSQVMDHLFVRRSNRRGVVDARVIR